MMKEETATVAEGAPPRKRLKEIKNEIVALKEKLVALKNERIEVQAKIKAARDAKEPKTPDAPSN